MAHRIVNISVLAFYNRRHHISIFQFTPLSEAGFGLWLIGFRAQTNSKITVQQQSSSSWSQYRYRLSPNNLRRRKGQIVDSIIDHRHHPHYHGSHHHHHHHHHECKSSYRFSPNNHSWCRRGRGNRQLVEESCANLLAQRVRMHLRS